MTFNAPKSPGWFLAMPYMHGERGIVVSRLGKVPNELAGAPFIYCDDILHQAADWQAYLHYWYDALAIGGKLILWVADSFTAQAGAGVARGLNLPNILDATLGMCAQYLEAQTFGDHAFVVIEKLHPEQERAQRMPWRKALQHALVFRTGAHGDALMASSIFPRLKAEGWAISVMTRKAGFQSLQHDPHVREFFVLPPTALQEHEQPAFWAAWAPRFDRVINLNHTVEDLFLKKSHRGDFYWPEAQRRLAARGSYLGTTHAAADVPGPYQVRFYPCATEQAYAESVKKRLGKFVLWSLQGSAVHKWWPYTAEALCQLLRNTDYQFVLTGDSAAVDLETDILQNVNRFYGNTERIHSAVNNRTVREVFALAQQADIVIGPETGVLNAVCLEKMAKIVLLSHSSAENLTDDWVNTTALVPVSPCYPCHRLHQNHDFCPQDAVTGAAACAASIPVPALVAAVLGARQGMALQNEVAA